MRVIKDNKFKYNVYSTRTTLWDQELMSTSMHQFSFISNKSGENITDEYSRLLMHAERLKRIMKHPRMYFSSAGGGNNGEILLFDLCRSELNQTTSATRFVF